jgi:hypothetical protein
MSSNRRIKSYKAKVLDALNRELLENRMADSSNLFDRSFFEAFGANRYHGHWGLPHTYFDIGVELLERSDIVSVSCRLPINTSTVRVFNPVTKALFPNAIPITAIAKNDGKQYGCFGYETNIGEQNVNRSVSNIMRVISKSYSHLSKIGMSRRPDSADIKDENLGPLFWSEDR